MFLYLYCWGGLCAIVFDTVLMMFWEWLPYARACLKVIVVSVRGVFLVILCYYVCVCGLLI